MKTYIEFDGYCPESKLKGKKVEMRLNENDFWESVETGLQMTVFPPYAAILRWRGKGKLRDSSDVASKTLKGLIITEAKTEIGKEIYPNEKAIIENESCLKEYFRKLY